MQRNYYTLHKGGFNFTINKMPIWFGEAESSGDEDNGRLVLKSNNEYDEAWGSNAKMEITWEKKERQDFFHAKEVQNTIDMYNAINVVVTEKNRIWVRSHEFTYWFGHRTKMIRKRVYPENSIHAVFYCEISERQFDIHATIIRKHYDGFKPYILEAFNSMICHE